MQLVKLLEEKHGHKKKNKIKKKKRKKNPTT